MTPSIEVQESFTIVRHDGHDFIKLFDGRLIPVMAGGEGDDGGDGNEPKEPTLTELMKLIQQQGSLIKAQQDQITKGQQKLDDLVGAIAEAMDGEGEGDGDNDVDDDEPDPAPRGRQNPNDQNPNNNQNSEEVATLRRSIKKMEKQMEEMQKQLKEREETAQQERELRLESQRDTLLQQALTEAGVVPEAMEAAMKYFRDDVVYDEDNDRFLFSESKTGVKLGISEGVKDNLPSYFKQTTIKQGGSGGRGSQPNAMLEQARSTLAKLHEQAKKSGSDSDIAAYHSAKKKLIEIESQGKPVGTPAPSGNGMNRATANAGQARGRQAAENFNDGES